MNTTTIRQKLHSYIEVADDRKLKAMYTVMEGEIEEAVTNYSEEFKTELDRRHKAYKNGAEKTVSASESKKRIKKLLNASRS